MQPLLKISTIPIKIEAQTKRASLQHSTDPVPASRPARPAPQRQVKVAPQPQPQPQPQPEQRVNQQPRGTQQRSPAADNASNYLQEASDAVQSHNQNITVGGSSVAEVAYTQASDVDYPPVSAVGTAPAQTAASSSFDYSMDRETFDWNANAKPQLEYVPASIEYSISQYPEVVIEYVGEPIYVPASANPNYVPPPETKGKA